MKSKTNSVTKWSFLTGTQSLMLAGIALIAVSQTTLAANAPVVKVGNELTNYGNTPLCTAILKGDVETVKKFIEYGADVNEMSNGMTPLMFAARYNKVAIVKFLLEKGADKAVKDEKGNTAIKYAELSNSQDVLTLLKQA
jgi:ankyrin repeat protein